MTKRNFEKLRKSIYRPPPNIKPNLHVSPSKDQKEEFLCSVPEDMVVDPEFMGCVKTLTDLIKHIGSNKFSAKTPDAQKKIFYDLRDLHQALFIWICPRITGPQVLVN